MSEMPALPPLLRTTFHMVVPWLRSEAGRAPKAMAVIGVHTMLKAMP